MTPRRTLWASLAATVLVLGACTAPTPNEPAPTEPAPTSAPSGDEAASDARHGDLDWVDRLAPEASVDLTFPLTWEDAPSLATGWTQAPLRRGDLFVSFAADEQAGKLIYSAIDSYGTVLWRAERPAACTGFAVSMAGEVPIVVLTDSRTADSGESAWQTTASGYALATGQRLWGPIAVPGTVQGPGLVFGASAPASTLGDVGPRVALDPGSGTVVASEIDDPGVSVVGEYDGTVLVANDHALRAIEAASGEGLWTFPAVGDSVVTPPNTIPPQGGALISPKADGPATLLDLNDGAIIASTVDDAVYEPLSRTWVWVEGNTVFGTSEVHEPWQWEFEDTPRISTAATGFVYLRVGDAVAVLNASTGRVAQAYPLDGDGRRFAVPSAISPRAAGVFRLDGRIVIAAVQRLDSGE